MKRKPTLWRGKAGGKQVREGGIGRTRGEAGSDRGIVSGTVGVKKE